MDLTDATVLESTFHQRKRPDGCGVRGRMRAPPENVGIATVNREHAHLVNDALALLFQFAPQALESRVGDLDPTERNVRAYRRPRHLRDLPAHFFVGFLNKRLRLIKIGVTRNGDLQIACSKMSDI